MLHTISGPSSVGKSILIERFVKENNFKRVVPYTSRKIRTNENETEGIEYYFRSKKELIDLSENFTKGYWDFPFEHVYGYASNIKDSIISEDKYIILATTNIALSLKKDFDEVKICFVDFQTEEELEKRITERFSPDNDFIKEKLLNAKNEKRYKDKFDIILEDNNPMSLYKKLSSLL